MPTLTIFAGINGAGKSTFYKQNDFDKADLGKRINPDEILNQFNGNWENRADQLKSGILAINQIKELINTQQSFNWEISLLSKYCMEYIKKAKESGYKINLYFVGIENLDIIKTRIQNRTKQGGHGVSDKVLLYKYKHQFDNIINVLNYVDTATFYDNTTNFSLVANYKNQTFTQINKDVNWANLFIENKQNQTSK